MLQTHLWAGHMNSIPVSHLSLLQLKILLHFRVCESVQNVSLAFYLGCDREGFELLDTDALVQRY